MNICVPIENDQGLNSAVCAHFGSAPAFMIVDVDKNALRAIGNPNQHQGHGHCVPLRALMDEKIDIMVVGAIGMGALGKLGAANIRVYASELPTVGEVLAAWRSGSLVPMDPGRACAGHDHSHC